MRLSRFTKVRQNGPPASGKRMKTMSSSSLGVKFLSPLRLNPLAKCNASSVTNCRRRTSGSTSCVSERRACGAVGVGVCAPVLRRRRRAPSLPAGSPAHSGGRWGGGSSGAAALARARGTGRSGSGSRVSLSRLCAAQAVVTPAIQGTPRHRAAGAGPRTRRQLQGRLVPRFHFTDEDAKF